MEGRFTLQAPLCCFSRLLPFPKVSRFMVETRPLQPVANGRGPEFLLDAYRSMQTIRMFESQVLQLSRGDAPEVVGSVHLCAGQEAIPVGALAALRPDDRVVATYRGHGWALESGITPDELMAEICHREAGINGGRAGSPYVTAPQRRFIGENSIVGAGGPIRRGGRL